MATVHCNFVDPIVWKSPSAASFARPEGVRVWRISVSAHLPLQTHLKSILTEAELEKAHSFRKEVDQQRFIVARGALRSLLSICLDCPPEAIQLGKGGHNKLYVQASGADQIFFNVAHSGDWVLIALAPSEIGIDLEQITGPFSYEGILERYFSPAEARFVREKDDSCKRFYLLWTRKEALLKATGRGLCNELEKVPSLDGRHEGSDVVIGSGLDWSIDSFGLGNDYIASIARSPLLTDICGWDLLLPLVGLFV
jgi:4'-phosphopantetheinyl transferase